MRLLALKKVVMKNGVQSSVTSVPVNQSLKNAVMVYSSSERQGSVLPYFFLDRYTDSYRIEWEDFARYIRDGGPSPVSGADGRAPVAIGIAAWESYRTGQRVAVDRG